MTGGKWGAAGWGGGVMESVGGVLRAGLSPGCGPRAPSWRVSSALPATLADTLLTHCCGTFYLSRSPPHSRRRFHPPYCALCNSRDAFPGQTSRRTPQATAITVTFFISHHSCTFPANVPTTTSPFYSPRQFPSCTFFRSHHNKGCATDSLSQSSQQCPCH